MNKKFFFFGLLAILVSFVTPIICIVKLEKFNQRCGGYLRQAADASTVELAINRMDIALEYIESNGLTEGYTSVLWKTEEDNVGFWYENIKSCRNELEAGLEGCQLEQTNLLMRVRESLIDDSGQVFLPVGIHKYPQNALWGILNWLSALLFSAGLVLVFVSFDEYYY